jgi:hypothetical protein
MKLLLLILMSFALLSSACSFSKKEEPGEESMEKATPPPAPAPGTAMATALVTGCDEKDDSFRCTFLIEQVAGYGASTPPLPVGSEVEVAVPKSVFGEDADGSKAAAMLALNNVVTVTLRHRQVMSTDGDTPPVWRVIDIH